MTGVEQMLALIKANPTLLPLAPAENQGAALDHRVADEIHTCLRCGDRAQCAFIANTAVLPGQIENRWLDLCSPCTDELYRLPAPMMHGAAGPTP